MATQTKLKINPETQKMCALLESVPQIAEAWKIGAAQLERGEYIEIPRESVKPRTK